MSLFLLTLLTTLSFAGDQAPHQVDEGLYAADQTGVAFLTTATDDGWYIEAIDRSGALLLDKAVVGSQLSEDDAVRVAIAVREQPSDSLTVVLGTGAQAQVTVDAKQITVAIGS